MKTAIFVDAENVIKGIGNNDPTPDFGAMLEATLQAVETHYGANPADDRLPIELAQVAVYGPWSYRCGHRPPQAGQFCGNCERVRKRLNNVRESLPNAIRRCTVMDRRTSITKRGTAKSLADGQIITEMVDYAHEHSASERTHFLLFAGDADYIPTAKWLRDVKKHRVTVIARPGETHSDWREEKFVVVPLVVQLPTARSPLQQIMPSCGNVKDPANRSGRVKIILAESMDGETDVKAGRFGDRFWPRAEVEFGGYFVDHNSRPKDKKTARKEFLDEFGADSLGDLANKIFQSDDVGISYNDEWFTFFNETEDGGAGGELASESTAVEVVESEGYAERGLGAGLDYLEFGERGVADDVAQPDFVVVVPCLDDATS